MTTMIPSEMPFHLRPQDDSLIRPIAPIQEVSADLPEFQLGQRFTARIDASLPDGTYRALVAGRSMTISLPQSARAGDTLDLVVLDRNTTTITAGRITAPSTTAANQAPATTLSPAGQLISNLLAHGEETPQSLATTRTAPLLAQPSASAAPLAPALQRAISESGLFYEAHQAQWIAGRLPLDSLLREPQGKSRPTPAPTPASPLGPAGLVQNAEALEQSEAVTASRTNEPLAKQPASTLPADLQPLVQRQLDTAATQQIVWRGDVWPGQSMHWEIEEEQRENARTSDDETPQWRTHLRLILPQLGDVAATLKLGHGGLTIELSAADNTSTNRLRLGQNELASALIAAGVPPTLIKVKQHEPA